MAPTAPATQTTAARLRQDEKAGKPPEDGLVLCLSGGGYRAMLFHAGVLLRLNEAGLLRQVDCVSSVSGGSITAGVLGLGWERLAFDARGVATNLEEVVVRPLRRLADRGIDVPAFLMWLARLGYLLPLPLHPARYVEGRYRRHLFGDATLQDLPAPGAGPRFVFNATNLQSGVRWAFEREAMYDYHVGTVLAPQVPLARAVAASSAFPPFLAPLILRPGPVQWETIQKPGFDDLNHPPYTTRIVLADGGVYGNLGLEEARYYKRAIVSDAGQRIKSRRRPWAFFPLLLARAAGVVYSQVRATQSRYVIDSLDVRHDDPAFDRWGRYCFMGTAAPASYRAMPGALDCPAEATDRLAAVPTRLWRMSAARQEALLNWGYARCDVVLRQNGDGKVAPALGFPFPGGVGQPAPKAKRAAMGVPEADG